LSLSEIFSHQNPVCTSLLTPAVSHTAFSLFFNYVHTFLYFTLPHRVTATMTCNYSLYATHLFASSDHKFDHKYLFFFGTLH
jgi:hypothetical protein